MIVKSYIEKSLGQFESRHIRYASVQEGLYYSKLAILELSGWVEITMDDIVLRLGKRLIQNSGHFKYLSDRVIRRTHSFEYETHFRRMLETIIGLLGVEWMEKRVNPNLFQPMVGALTSLKHSRDEQAHQYIKGTTHNIDAPSLTKSRFYTIFNGLRNVDNVLRSFKQLK